jgi:hypothetical protein
MPAERLRSVQRSPQKAPIRPAGPAGDTHPRGRLGPAGGGRLGTPILDGAAHRPKDCRFGLRFAVHVRRRQSRRSPGPASPTRDSLFAIRSSVSVPIRVIGGKENLRKSADHPSLLATLYSLRQKTFRIGGRLGAGWGHPSLPPGAGWGHPSLPPRRTAPRIAGWFAIRRARASPTVPPQSRARLATSNAQIAPRPAPHRACQPDASASRPRIGKLDA